MPSASDTNALVSSALQCVRNCVVTAELGAAVTGAPALEEQAGDASVPAAETAVPATALTGKGGKGGTGAATALVYSDEGFVSGYKVWVGDLHFKTAQDANQTLDRWLADANCHCDDKNIRPSVARTGEWWGVLTWRDAAKCQTAFVLLRSKLTRDSEGHMQPLRVK